MIYFDSVTYNYPPLTSDPLNRDPASESHITALDNISFRVEAGHCLAVIGANGSGKSTLCLAAAGLAPRLSEGRITGTIMVASRNVQSEPPGALADMIGIVLQDPEGQLFNPTIADEIAWGLENLGIPSVDMTARIAASLAMVGLDHLPWDRPPNRLSGGEQKRLALASMLALRPHALILDEPSGGLAPSGSAEMIDTLSRLRSDTNLAILLAENDPEVVAALADHVLVLDTGRIVDQGIPLEVYARLGHTRTAVPVPPATIFNRALADHGGPEIDGLTVTKIAQTLSKISRLSSQKATDRQTHEPEVQVRSSSITLDSLSFAYDPAYPVLTNITLTITQGQFAALTGENGAGKTTLARHLIGLLRPDAGSIRIMGEDTTGESIGQLARMVGFAFQSPELQIFNSTVRDEIAFGPKNLGWPAYQIDVAVSAALTRFDLHAIADLPPAALSFSTRRMIALASIAAMQTPILVLDEPTVGLDAAGQTLVTTWLNEHHRAGGTILLITHDMELVARHAERMIVLDSGHITADSSPPEVFIQSDVLHHAGLHPPFAMRLADALNNPALAVDLTPEGVASAWLALQPGTSA
jgi:energy-coupling factor transport system ATP-binding protein